MVSWDSKGGMVVSNGGMVVYMYSYIVMMVSWDSKGGMVVSNGGMVVYMYSYIVMMVRWDSNGGMVVVWSLCEILPDCSVSHSLSL